MVIIHPLRSKPSIVALISISIISIFLAGCYSIDSRIIASASAQESELATTRTMINSETLRELDHSPEDNYAYVFEVFDWSHDGKFILFGYHDYADPTTSQIDSLGIIDVKTFNVTKLNVLTVNENNTKEIYTARMSPEGDSVFVLLGTKAQNPGRPEDIFRYDLSGGTLARITNSSTVAWFDTLDLDDAKLAYIDSSGFHLWPVDNAELGSKINALAESYYKFLPPGDANLDIDAKASKLVFTGVPNSAITYIDVLSGKTQMVTPRNPCVKSATFAPNAELVVYSEHPGYQCPAPAYEGAALRAASLDGTFDEILFIDKLAVPDTIISPDGKYAATFGYGEIEQEKSPKLLLLELSRSLPEFNSYVGIAAVVISIGGIIVAARLLTAGQYTNQRNT